MMFKDNINRLMGFVRQRQQMLILVSAGLLVGGFVLFRYLPLRKQTKILRQSIADRQALISQAAAKRQQLPLMQQKLSKFQERVENYEKNIPVQIDIGGFLGKVADLMTQHNLTEQVIQPKEEVAVEKLNCIPVTMKCSGSLAQIRQFYQSLNDMDRLVRVEKFELTNDRDFAGQVSMVTEAVIYYASEAKNES